MLTQSNAEAIKEALCEEVFEDDVRFQEHNHWAVGWVGGFAIRVYRRPVPGDKSPGEFCRDWTCGCGQQWTSPVVLSAHSSNLSGESTTYCPTCYEPARSAGPAYQITAAFRKLCELMEAMDDYPCLDEADHSRREYEATIENIKEVGKRFLIDNPPEDWAAEVFSYFWDNDQQEVEARDGGGGYPSEKGMKEALFQLDILDEEAGGVMSVEVDGECLLKTLEESEAFQLAEHAYWKRLGTGRVVIRVSEEVIHEEVH